MDDLLEGQTAESSTLASFMCVSSWTDEAVDSIPFWREYAGLKNGVMIRLCTNPFKRFPLTVEEKAEIQEAKLGVNLDAEFLLPYSVLRSLKYCPMAINNELLNKVIYVNDENLTSPKIVERKGEDTWVHFGKLGLYKQKAWEYQREWRYRVLLIPFGLHEMKTEGIDVDVFNAEVEKKYSRLSPIRYIDLPLRDDAFESMKITTSPQLSFGNHIILKLLQNKFNPTMEIESSKLMGMIR